MGERPGTLATDALRDRVRSEREREAALDYLRVVLPALSPDDAVRAADFVYGLQSGADEVEE